MTKQIIIYEGRRIMICRPGFTRNKPARRNDYSKNISRPENQEINIVMSVGMARQKPTTEQQDSKGSTKKRRHYAQ